MPSHISMTARQLVGDGRGILAADESVGTMNKRLETAGVPATSEMRSAYREMLVRTPGLSECISGVILSHDILSSDTVSELCADAGLIVGIKVDTGAKPLAGAPGELVTEGLDALRERLEQYAGQNARFTKWRAVIRIDEGLPTARAINANAHALARYAALAQEAGLVPVVEPEVLMDGDHDIDRCRAVTEAVLEAVFDELEEQCVELQGIVLKPNMVLAGASAPHQPTVDEVATTTVRMLRRAVPAAVPGIAFLSGGQGEEAATEHLRAMNRLGTQPWELTFSFGRALVDPALRAWRGRPEDIGAGQRALLGRAQANARARAVCAAAP